MVRIETDRGVKLQATLTLDAPVATSHGRVDRIIVASSEARARGLAAQRPKRARTSVTAPLTSLQLEGVPAGSRPFKRFQKRLESRGFTLRAAAASGYDPSFQTTLTGGASVAALGSRESLWFGGAGTVTYLATDTLIAFGHPIFWEGFGKAAWGSCLPTRRCTGSGAARLTPTR